MVGHSVPSLLDLGLELDNLSRIVSNMTGEIILSNCFEMGGFISSSTFNFS
jgi:hypothetical protein